MEEDATCALDNLCFVSCAAEATTLIASSKQELLCYQKHESHWSQCHIILLLQRGALSGDWAQDGSGFGSGLFWIIEASKMTGLQRHDNAWPCLGTTSTSQCCASESANRFGSLSACVRTCKSESSTQASKASRRHGTTQLFRNMCCGPSEIGSFPRRRVELDSAVEESLGGSSAALKLRFDASRNPVLEARPSLPSDPQSPLSGAPAS